MGYLLFFAIIIVPPLLCILLAVFLFRWMIALFRVCKYGMQEDNLKERLLEKRNYWILGAIVFAVTVTALICWECFGPVARRYEYVDSGLGQEEIVKERPDIEFSIEDEDLLKAIVSSPELQPFLQAPMYETHNEFVEQDIEKEGELPNELVEKLISNYESKPSGKCRITYDRTYYSKRIYVDFLEDSKWILRIWFSDDADLDEGFTISAKFIQCYEDGVTGEPDYYKDTEALYRNLHGSIDKEIPRRKWFSWIEYYTQTVYLMFHG